MFDPADVAGGREDECCPRPLSLRKTDRLRGALLAGRRIERVRYQRSNRRAIIARLARRPDAGYLDLESCGHTGSGKARCFYERRLETAHPTPKGFCIPDYEQDCPCKGSPYDGIDDIFEGKASETHCWQNGWHIAVSGD
ncbi:MAG TPA: hypothetical protein VGJ81_18160 [Thermoanaerobaculia bacterium]|jgi:hypothetical protein